MERLSTLSSHLCSKFASAESDLRHVLVVGGDSGFAGAARMAGEGAARSGTGLTTIATRAALFDKYADGDVLIIGTHFPSPTAGRIRSADVGAYWLDTD